MPSHITVSLPGLGLDTLGPTFGGGEDMCTPYFFNSATSHVCPP